MIQKYLIAIIRVLLEKYIGTEIPDAGEKFDAAVPMVAPLRRINRYLRETPPDFLSNRMKPAMQGLIYPAFLGTFLVSFFQGIGTYSPLQAAFAVALLSYFVVLYIETETIEKEHYVIAFFLIDLGEITLMFFSFVLLGVMKLGAFESADIVRDNQKIPIADVETIGLSHKPLRDRVLRDVQSNPRTSVKTQLTSVLILRSVEASSLTILRCLCDMKI